MDGFEMTVTFVLSLVLALCTFWTVNLIPTPIYWIDSVEMSSVALVLAAVVFWVVVHKMDQC